MVIEEPRAPQITEPASFFTTAVVASELRRFASKRHDLHTDQEKSCGFRTFSRAGKYSEYAGCGFDSHPAHQLQRIELTCGFVPAAEPWVDVYDRPIDNRGSPLGVLEGRRRVPMGRGECAGQGLALAPARGAIGTWLRRGRSRGRRLHIVRRPSW